MYSQEYTQHSRKAKEIKRKAKIAIVITFLVLAYGYVGNSDYETKQLETNILFSHQ